MGNLVDALGLGISTLGTDRVRMLRSNLDPYDAKHMSPLT